MDKFIKIGKEKVPVSEEVYKEFYRMDRRERYMEMKYLSRPLNTISNWLNFLVICF